MQSDFIELEVKGKSAQQAAQILAKTPTSIKNQALQNIATNLKSRQDEILAANKQDYKCGQQNGLGEALLDRLLINTERLDTISADIENIVKLADPIGQSMDARIMPNGLQVSRRRVPLGVIGAIYESRPNITIEISALCLKSGNAVILRGGKEALHTNSILAKISKDAIEDAGIPADSIQFIESPSHALVNHMLQMKDTIDLLIPRGGQELINRIAEEAVMPVITGGVGVCHAYVDKSANLESAVDIVDNAKLQRPSVCNALDTLIIHSEIAPTYLPAIVSYWAETDIEMRCDQRTLSILGHTPNLQIVPATEEDWGTEFLSAKIAVKIVDSIDDALIHIHTYGSGHSDAIITEDYSSAMKFMNEVDSSAVMVNASTRFNDGSQLGLGAEVAISTNKIHARGPVGLNELTSYKWIIMGKGQIRR